MQSVSIIGLGVMGAALARVLLETGYKVTVWNRSPEKAASLVAAGALPADSPAHAIQSSKIIITCIRTHSDTQALLETEPAILDNRIIVELSTGDASQAEALKEFVEGHNAQCLIGMIATFPSGIGKPDSAIVTVGDEETWRECEQILKALAGKSTYIGTSPKALAAIYASLFLPRQGFMFGMIYGALICEKAGLSMDTYVEQLPLTIKVVHDYFDVFAASMPSGDFSNPPASIGTYMAAFEDTLKTCEKLGVPRDLPQLLHDHVKQGIDAGLADEQITALTKILKA